MYDPNVSSEFHDELSFAPAGQHTMSLRDICKYTLIIDIIFVFIASFGILRFCHDACSDDASVLIVAAAASWSALLVHLRCILVLAMLAVALLDAITPFNGRLQS